jgi:hypothetical protein
MVIEKHGGGFSWRVEPGIGFRIGLIIGHFAVIEADFEADFEAEQPINDADKSAPCENPKSLAEECFIFAQNKDNHQPAAPEQKFLGLFGHQILYL